MSSTPQHISKSELNERHLKQLMCWEEVQEILILAISGDRSIGKGSRKRKEFLSFLRCLLHRPPTTEEEEYQRVNKFGRGGWRRDLIDSFNEEEKELIINTVAPAWGAFDY
jgi:hypothetical protein